ncbi:reverse transcriptase domain-containing protein [Tanacetum coccineum]
MIVYPDHSTLRHPFKKQDVKPHVIRWILLLQEIDIKIKYKKDTENVAADHLSRINNDETSDDSDVDDNFPGETLMEITTKDTPWFVDFSNYLVGDIIPKGMTYQQRNKFFSDIKNYFWEDPYLFKVCSYGMIRRCVSGPKTRSILDQCHHGPTSEHYGPNTTTKKVLDLGFYWPTIIKEAPTLVRLYEACQKTRNISKLDEIPLNSIQVHLKTSHAQNGQDTNVYAHQKTSYKKRNDKSNSTQMCAALINEFNEAIKDMKCTGFPRIDTKNEVVRLMMFTLSLTGEAKTWLDELNEGTIETWDELRTAFISRFFYPAFFDRLLGEIRAFSKHENESLTDAWLCMK